MQLNIYVPNQREHVLAEHILIGEHILVREPIPEQRASFLPTSLYRGRMTRERRRRRRLTQGLA
jgi:hypothetical protein